LKAAPRPVPRPVCSPGREKGNRAARPEAKPGTLCGLACGHADASLDAVARFPFFSLMQALLLWCCRVEAGTLRSCTHRHQRSDESHSAKRASPHTGHRPGAAPSRL
jgi:hypothetical protein